MRIYVASTWAYRKRARSTAQFLRDHGHTIVSRWHDEWADQDETAVPATFQQDEATKDIADVGEAQVLLVLNLEKSEGKAVEQGLALAYNIPVILVGERTNVFHYLPAVTVVGSIEQAVDTLVEMERGIHV